MSNVAPVLATAERDKYIPSEVKAIQAQVERLEGNKNQPVSVLAPITTPDPVDGEGTTQPSTGVPLADDLNLVAGDLTRINQTLEDLLSRVEI